MDVSLKHVSLSEINDTVGSPPNSKFLASVRRMGVVQPVLLTEHTTDAGEIQYSIVDGNRRIRAARKTKLDRVPAVVISHLDAVHAAQLTLIANGFRSPNYLSEFWAIKSLERSRYNSSTIMKISGMSESVMATRNTLRHLRRDLFVALRNGRLPQTYALSISKMEVTDQESLATIYNRTGRLLKRDIDLVIAKSRKIPPSIPTEIIPSTTETSVLYQIDFPRPDHAPTVEPEVLNQIAPADPGATETLQNPDATQSLSNTPQRIAAVTTPPTDDNRYPQSDFNLGSTSPKARLDTLLRNSVFAAQNFDLTKEEFLELAAEKWDSAIRSSAS